jgi:hypothetical protein
MDKVTIKAVAKMFSVFMTLFRFVESNVGGARTPGNHKKAGGMMYSVKTGKPAVKFSRED